MGYPNKCLSTVLIILALSVLISGQRLENDTDKSGISKIFEAFNTMQTYISSVIEVLNNDSVCTTSNGIEQEPLVEPGSEIVGNIIQIPRLSAKNQIKLQHKVFPHHVKQFDLFIPNEEIPDIGRIDRHQGEKSDDK